MRKLQLKQHQRQKISLKTKLIIASSSLLLVLVGAFIFFNLNFNKEALAAAIGDYRSKATGNWNNILTWETYNGTIWIAAIATPTSSNGIITIRNGHTVTVTANVSIDQTIVESGGTLTISAGTLTIANGTGSDLDVSGTANLNAGTVSISSSALITLLSGGIWNYNGGTETTTTGWAINNGATYVHNVNSVNVPNATWGTTSTLKITGVTTTDPDVQSQIFGHVIYDCASQTGNLDFKDKLQDIAGDFTVVNTGTGTIKFDKSSTNEVLYIGGNFSHTGGTMKITNQGNWTISVTGNFLVSGGTFIMAGTDGVPIMTVGGNISITGGTLDMSQYTGNTSSKGVGTINLIGNFTQTGGAVTETATNVGKGDINFAKTGTQTFSITGGSITNQINFTVNSGSILDAGTNVFTGAGTFTVASGGSLILAHTGGISSSGATGNIQVTGARTFSTGGNYTYNGTAAQASGTGLPSQVNNFTINNSAGITLTNSVIVASILTLTSGNVTTNANILSLGTSQASSNTGTLVRTSGHIIGYIRRWMSSSITSDVLFPVGSVDYYEGANVSITSSPSGGTVTAKYTEAANSWHGLELREADGAMIETVADGYWEMTTGDGMSAGAWTLNLYANSLGPIMSDYTQTHIIRKTLLTDPWSLNGLHSAGTGSNLNPIANRTNMTLWGIYAIGGGSTNPLPVTLANFTAKAQNENTVLLNWITVAEVNNDYFTIERSQNGTQFSTLTKVEGSGNTTDIHKYSFTDIKPLGGTSYYRLKQTDFNGTSATFKTVSVTFKTRQTTISSIQISPNPFTDSFTAQFDSPEKEEVSINILSTNGVLVFSEKVMAQAGNNALHYSNLPGIKKGSYMMRVSGANAVIATGKIVCNK